MKKFLTAMASVIAVVVLAFTLAGCSKSGAVQKAFEKEGYTVSVTAVADYESDVKAILGEEDYNKVKDGKLLVCTKLVVPTFVISFGSTGKLKDYFDSDEDYNKAVDNGTVNGDCLLISISPAAIDIFKNA